jgi:RimJ/RimL family protein N-acetyltransferase
MTQLTAPAQPLTDGVLTLRLPSPAAGDIDTVRSCIDQVQLDDAWLPGIPLIPAEQAINDWLNGWAGRPSRDGPIFVVTVPGEPRFIGIIGLGDRGDGVIEMVYGIAPRWRGRGLASRATRLAARWALSQPGVSTTALCTTLARPPNCSPASARNTSRCLAHGSRL